MSDPHPPPRNGRSARRLDALCDRFETDWRRGLRPRIEDALGEAAGSERPRLLRELLGLELELRRGDGEEPTVEEYHARFPDDLRPIAAAFAETSPDGATVPMAPPRPAADVPVPFVPSPARRVPGGGGPRFRVLRRHARGGLGEVFVAYDEELRREVALKEIRPERSDDADSRARFVLEAEITGSLEHPGIVPVYGLGEFGDGRPFYAMRLVRGESLKAAVNRFHADDAPGRDPGGRTLALRALLRRFVDVCNAIAYAHNRGVLHRDLKPANIMLGPFGETLVVDWGLAKPVGPAGPDGEARAAARPSPAGAPARTREGDAPGTPAFMSPEQAAGAPAGLGPASDIYSLGATLHCLLTGRVPDPPVGAGDGPGRSAGAGAPPALEAICHKAMAVAPGDRYETARALADDVERWLADEPVSAWREPRPARARRWARRHRTPVAAMIVALAAGAVGLGAVAAVEARANRRLERAGAAKGVALAEARDARKAAEAALARARHSEAEARAALASSEESRRQAEAVSRFLVGAFRGADPAADGRELKVVEVLDRAVARLGEDFGGPPAIRAALLDALGQTYQGLGRYDAAAGLLVRALELREASLGPDHAETLRTRDRLGIACCDAGRLDQALAIFESALRRREAVLGRDHLDTLGSCRSLAFAYWSLGRRADALSLLRATLRRQEAALGADHPETFTTCNNLANCDLADGRLAEATALYESTLRRMEARLGPDHPNAIKVRINLASCYRLAGRPGEAIAMAEAAREKAGRRLGRDHPETLAAVTILAVQYEADGRLSEALRLYRAVLERQEAGLRPDHSETQTTRHNVAGVHEALGRWGEAEPLRRRVLDLRRRSVGADSLVLAEDLVALGRNLTGQARWAEAASLLGEALAIRERISPDDWSRYDEMSMLGGALLGLGRHAEAEPLIVGGYEGMKARETRITVTERYRLREAAERIARLYESWDRPDEAAAWKASLGLRDLPAEVFARP